MIDRSAAPNEVKADRPGLMLYTAQLTIQESKI
jgi:hypothetical protein